MKIWPLLSQLKSQAWNWLFNISCVLFLYLLLKNLPLSLFCFRRLLMVWFWFLTIYCFLNSASDLPSVRHEAVQAWLETVPGGSLVMFYVFQCTITLPVSSPCLQQLSWYFNPGLTALSLLHDEVEGGRGRGSVHARLAQTVRSCMNSTCVVTLLKAGQTDRLSLV